MGERGINEALTSPQTSARRKAAGRNTQAPTSGARSSWTPLICQPSAVSIIW